MPIICNIEFENNPLGAFFGGQNLTTKVYLHLDEDKEICGVAFKILGYGHMHWVDDNRSYTRYENYINVNTFLLGTPTSEPITLKAGKHTLSHDYQLPLSCPSSIESQYVQIRYKIKVILHRTLTLDKTFKKLFTVTKVVDLNREPMLSCSITRKCEKKFGKSRNSTPPLCMSVSLPRSGYVPGQKIPVSIFIANESGKLIKELKVSLVMVTSSHGNRPVPKVFDWITRVSKLKDDALVNQDKFNSIYELPVPPTPPSDQENSNLLHISYQVKVEAVMPLLQPNQVIILPVCIGNVPLTDEHNNEGAHNNLSTVLESSETLPTYSRSHETSFNPPPTYEEAISNTKMN